MTAKNETIDQEKAVSSLLQKVAGGKWDGLGNNLVAAFGVPISRWLSTVTAAPITKFVIDIASKKAGLSDLQAAKLARKVETGWRLGLPTLLGSIGGLKRLTQDFSQYNELSRKFQPTLAIHKGHSLGFASLLSSDLEVVKTARGNSAKKIKNSFKAVGASIVALIPVGAASLVDQWLDDVHKASKTREGSVSTPQFDDEIDRLRYESAEKVERTMRQWIGKLNPENSDKNNTLRTASINAGLNLLGASDLDHYTGTQGPHNLLRSIKEGILGKYELGGGFIADLINRKIGVKGSNAFSQPSADKMIFALQDALHQDPSLAKVHKLIGQSEESQRLEEYIEDIFRQHEKDRGRAEIPRVVEDQLQEACKEIAEAMTDPYRKLHPQAMAILTDKKHGILIYENDRVSDVMERSELVQRIQELSAANDRIQEVERESEEEYYANRSFTKEDFAQSWDNLTEDEKFIWSSFFPDTVLEGIGVSDEEIALLRAEGNEYWQEVVEATFDALKGYNTEKLKDLGLNQKQANEYAALIKSHLQGRSDEVVKKRREAMELTAELGVILDVEKPGFISDILEKAIDKRDSKLSQRRRRAEESFADKFGGKKADTEQEAGESKSENKNARRSRSRQSEESAAHSM